MRLFNFIQKESNFSAVFLKFFYNQLSHYELMWKFAH